MLLYSPSRFDPEILELLTVGKSRQGLIETLVEAVRAELDVEVHQHQLLVGPRGSGKTHTLAVVARRIEADPELGRRVLVISLAEEEVATHPADVMIKILERLEERLVTFEGINGRSQGLGIGRDVLDRLRLEANDDQALILATAALDEIAGVLNRLLVAQVENLDSILLPGYARQRELRAQWNLRKTLMESKGLMLMASAPSFFGEISDPEAPFYDLFRTHSLSEVPVEDLLQLIQRRIELRLSEGDLDDGTRRRLLTLLEDFPRRGARLRGVLVMTGGLPRFAHLFFDLLTETEVTTTLGLLERFLDAQTPYFQSRLDPRILPKTEIEVLEVLATAPGPLAVREITKQIRGGVQGNISNYLKRLRQQGLVRQRGRGRKVFYDVAEPLYRVWRQFRIGRDEQERIVKLAQIIAAVYEPSELRKEISLSARNGPQMGDFRQEVIKRAYEYQTISTSETVKVPQPKEADRKNSIVAEYSEKPEEVYRVMASISSPRFQSFVDLVRHLDESGIRKGIIRFCTKALTSPSHLQDWLPLFEVELTRSYREILRPIRLALEMLLEQTEAVLAAESEEMRRVVDQLLNWANEVGPFEIGEADLVNELLLSLKQEPTTSALDALWGLRCDLESEENVRESFEVMKALNLCVASNGANWLRRTIRQADPAANPVHELAYLMLHAEEGREVWYELKEVLFEKIETNHERSIASCLEQFRDVEHIDWLVERVNRKDDLLGAAARRALFVLRPGRAPDPIEGELDFYLASRWWLLQHLNAASPRIQDFLDEIFKGSKDPWNVTSHLHHVANRISPEVLDHLLERMLVPLKEALALGKDANKAPLWRPSLFLEKIRSLRLIERFEAHRESETEKLLAQWLCQQGAQNSWMQRPVEQKVIQVLKRFGGPGLTRVAHHYLLDGRTFPALLEAVELAVMRPDEQTAEKLYDLVLREEVEGSKFPIAQNAAVGALAAIGRTDLALQGVVRLGFKLQNKVPALFSELEASEDDLQPVLNSLKVPEGPQPGAVLALGLSHRKDQVPRIHALLKEASAGSELSRACLLALQQLGDDSAETIQALIENLAVSENEYVARTTLFCIQTPEAIHALKVSRKRAVIADLLRLPEVRTEVAEQLWAEMDREQIPSLALGSLQGFAELDDPDVFAWLADLAYQEEGVLRFGTRIGAIRALMVQKPKLAFEAAESLLNPGATDREHIPALLLEIDTERALFVLSELMTTEKSVLMITAVGEALHLASKTSALVKWLEAPSADLRRNSCIAAEVFNWSDDLAAVLRKHLYDSDWDVRTAASKALDRLWLNRELDCLVSEMIRESNTTRRWCLLDIFLEDAYPGLVGRYDGQPWLKRLIGHLSPAMCQRVNERLGERRKEITGELKKRER